jgi:hypothetical protein
MIRVLTILTAVLALALAVTAQPASAKRKGATLTMYATDGSPTAKYYLEATWPEPRSFRTAPPDILLGVVLAEVTVGDESSGDARRSSPRKLPSRHKTSEISLTRGLTVSD